MRAVTSQDPWWGQVARPRCPSDAGGGGALVGATPALTVVLPCYNEAERLPGTLRALLGSLAGFPGQVEVVVVDDGSSDATVVVAEAVAAGDRRVRVLSYQPNRGKGYAVRTGMLAAGGELIVFTDADGAYDPSQLARIVVALGEVPVAIGVRTTGGGGSVARQVASWAFRLVVRGVLGLGVGDTQSGLKGFRRSAARQLFGCAGVDGFAFDVEVLWLARQLGLEVAEVGVQAMGRAGSKVWVLADAVGMLGEVWAVRQAGTRGGGGGGLGPARPEPATQRPAFPVRRRRAPRRGACGSVAGRVP